MFPILFETERERERERETERGLWVHFGLIDGPFGALGRLFVSWDAKKEARRIQKAISDQHKNRDICMGKYKSVHTK